jgi:ribosomal protein L1
MGFAESVKKMMYMAPKQMTGASIEIDTPLATPRYCYDIGRAAECLGLRGLFELRVDQTVKIDLEGEFDTIDSFLRRLENGKIVPTKVGYNLKWTPFGGRYSRVRVSIGV